MNRDLTSRLRAAWQVITKGWETTFNRVTESSEPTGPRLDQPMAQSVWVMRAIKKISGPIAAVSLYHTLADDDFNDPALTDFWRAPAARLSFPDFIEASVGWLKLAGECFWLLGDEMLVPFPDVGPRRAPMIVARPDRMRELMDGAALIGWEYTDARGRRTALLPEQVVQLKFWNPYNDIRGLAEYEAARIATESDYQAGNFALNLMRNNGDRGVYVIAKSGIPDDAQREQIVNSLRMKRDACQRGNFRPVFLTGDISIEDPKIQVPDAAFAANRLENRHEIFIAFGVPPSMADVQASYSIGSASDRFMLIEETCMPTGVKLAEGIEIVSRKLTGKPVEAAFNWDEHSVMQQVRSERIDGAQKLWSMGMPLEKINDYLDLDMPDFPGWETGYLPFSVAPVGAPERTPATPPASSPEYAETTEEEPVAAMLRALQTTNQQSAIINQQSAISNLQSPISNPAKAPRPAGEIAHWSALMAQRRETLKAFQTKFSRALMRARADTLSRIDGHKSAISIQQSAISNQKSLSTRSAAADFIFNLVPFKNLLCISMRNVAATALQIAGKQLFEELGRDDPWSMPTQAAKDFLAARQNLMSGVADEVHARVMDAVQDSLDAGQTMTEIADAVRAEFNAIDKGRALVIAQTETNTAYGFARQKALESAGITEKRWLTSGNDNVRDAHDAANGQVVPVAEPFLVGGEQLMYPGDPDGVPQSSPANVINCHCCQVAVARDETPRPAEEGFGVPASAGHHAQTCASLPAKAGTPNIQPTILFPS